MSRLLTALALIALVAGCDSANPFQNTDDPTDVDPTDVDPTDPVTTEGIPESLAGNLSSISFTPGDGTITVTGVPFDQVGTSFPEAIYNRNTNLDVPGYVAYTYQDDPLDRMFVAIIAESVDGGVQAGVVSDGGQFAEFFGGGFYRQVGAYTPDTGLVSYGGTYTALTNVDADGAELLDASGTGAGSAILPEQPAQIVGDIFIVADFGQNQINGGIENLEYVNVNPAYITLFGSADLPDVFLLATSIGDDGSFLGDVQNSALEGIGVYGGTFGGTDAAGVGGIVALEGDWDPNVESEFQYGTFVLTQCGEPGDAAICDGLN